MKYVPPSIAETAFNCPHCGALAMQFWSSAVANKLGDNQRPSIIDEARHKKTNFKDVEDEKKRKELERWLDLMVKGQPFVYQSDASIYNITRICNLHFSRCYNCNDISIWIYDRLIWPQRGEGPEPNADLPDDVRTDYDEASTILDLSTRGAPHSRRAPRCRCGTDTYRSRCGAWRAKKWPRSIPLPAEFTVERCRRVDETLRPAAWC